MIHEICQTIIIIVFLCVLALGLLFGCGPGGQTALMFQPPNQAYWQNYQIQNSIDQQTNQQALDALIYRSR